LFLPKQVGPETPLTTLGRKGASIRFNGRKMLKDANIPGRGRRESRPHGTRKSTGPLQNEKKKENGNALNHKMDV